MLPRMTRGTPRSTDAVHRPDTIGPTDWSLEISAAGPSLYPSVGNWQQACQSHYWIRGGVIVWAEAWTPEQIEMGRAGENARSRAYYDELHRTARSPGRLARGWAWIKRLFGSE
jgi:hypothetical protein